VLWNASASATNFSVRSVHAAGCSMWFGITVIVSYIIVVGILDRTWTNNLSPTCYDGVGLPALNRELDDHFHQKLSSTTPASRPLFRPRQRGYKNTIFINLVQEFHSVHRKIVRQIGATPMLCILELAAVLEGTTSSCLGCSPHQRKIGTHLLSIKVALKMSVRYCCTQVQSVLR